MTPTLKVLLLAATIVLLGAVALANREKVYYFDFEHMNLTYYNEKFYDYLNVTNLRYGRRDPLHYINVHAKTTATIGNNVTVDVYFYEFLSNEYRRSFVELHAGFCDVLLTDKFMSPFFKRFFDKSGCPLKPGFYHVENISFANVPQLQTFPFTRGRIYINGSVWTTGERVFEVYFDAIIKQKWKN